MWFNAPKLQPDWAEAQAHLRRVMPAFGGIIERVGPCGLHPRRDYFVALSQAIFSQQVATPVAEILFERFRGLFPARRPTPQRVLALSDVELRSVGLSRQKMAYLRDLADKFASGQVQTRRLGRMSDEEIIATLTQVHGIGRWTAEMFLIFVLNRPDVLPVDDLGLRRGAQMLHGLAELPAAREVVRLGEPWRPYRSVATWYLWRGMAGDAGKDRQGDKETR